MGASLSLVTPIASAIGFVVTITVASHLLPPSTNDNFVNTLVKVGHVGAFSFSFGIQLWMTFVNGLTLIKLVPRYTFSKVQRVLFYKYFLIGFVTNGIMLATYLIKHPFQTWEGESLYMGSAIIAGGLVSSANVLFIKDYTITTMDDMHEFEKKHDLTDDVGTFKCDDYKENVEYMVVRKKFYLSHGISAINNLIGIAVSGLQLWFLSRNLQM